MDDDVRIGGRPERRPRRIDAGLGVGFDDADGLDAGDAADLGIVDDEKVEVRKARPHDLGQPLRREAREFEIGHEAGGPRLFRVATQPLASPAHGPSISAVDAGQAEMEDGR